MHDTGLPGAPVTLKHFLLIGLTAILAPGFVTPASANPGAIELPAIGDPADAVMSPAEERRLGQRTMTRIRAQGMVIDEPELTAYLREVGYRLVAQAGQQEQEFHFFIVDSPGINAFALPGGFIGVNAGLILATRDESELAGVLAHEITHVTQRHIARRVQATRGVDMATAVTVLAAILLGGGDPNILAGAISGGLAASVQNTINYTLAYEYEADRIGINLMAGAGFDPEGMSRFFERLAQQNRFREGGLEEFLRTHPVTSARVSEARNRARSMPGVNAQSSMSYLLARARLRVMSVRTLDSAIEYFNEAIRQTAGNELTAARYGLALAHQATGKPEQAREILQPLVENNREVPALRLALARSQAGTGEPEAALRTLERANEVFPRNYALNIEYAGMLLEQGQPEKARERLLRVEYEGNPDARLLRLLARSSRETGRPVDEHFYLSEYNLLRGDLNEAIAQLRLALETGDINQGRREQLENRLAQLREIRQQ